jgi:hypothetical protein
MEAPSLADQEAQIKMSGCKVSEFTIDDLVPVSGTELLRLKVRRAKLAKVAAEAARADQKFAEFGTRQHLWIRRDFVVRQEAANLPGDPSDRRLPARRDRPPATRLVSPRGVALRFFLTALFVLQSGVPFGRRPGNKIPIDDPDTLSWVDLIATPAQRTGESRTYSGVRDKKVRQLHEALRRLSDPEVQLVELPYFHKRPTGKYEGFLLMREGGAPYDGTDNTRYTVPALDGEESLVRLPSKVLLNGWIHVLEDSELAFLLMLAGLRSRFGDKQLFAAGELRLLHFGIGRDAYQSHHMLRRLGLIDVEEDHNRYVESGHVRGYSEKEPPKLHRFRLLDAGFEQPALPTAQEAIERCLRQ